MIQVMKLFAKQFCHLTQIQIFTFAHTYKMHSICTVPLVPKISFYPRAKQNIELHFYTF